MKLYRRALEIEPESLLATSGIGQAFAGALEWEEAQEWLGRAAGRSSRAPFYLGLLAWVQAASGRQVEARRTLDELERRAATEYVAPIFRAWALSELNEPDKTRALLQEAIKQRNGTLLISGMPCFHRLRAEPLMEDLRQRLLGEERESRPV